MALTEKLTAIADAIREKTGSTEEMTLTEMAEAVSGISVGENLPEAETVSFSAEQISPDVRYAIGYNWFARLVERTQVMSGLKVNFTPEEIVYWLGRVAIIPQGHFVSGASGILPTVYKGYANSEFSLNFKSSATGALSE